MAFVLRWLATMGAFVAVTILLLGCFAAYSARSDAWQLAEQQSADLLLALRMDIDHNITGFDLSLQEVGEALAEPGIDAVSPGIRHHALFDRAAGAEDLGTIVVTDSSGKVSESSARLPISWDAADREEFTVQRDRPAAGLYLGHPSGPLFAGDRPSIWMSRRLTAPDGRFAGVVSGALRLDFFRQLFERIEIGPKGSISLIRSDGRLVWRYPSGVRDVDRDVGGSMAFRKMAASGDGRFVGPSDLDGVTRLHTFARVGTLPLLLSVNFAVDDIYARWRQKALVILPALLAMCASVMILSLMFNREMRRRTLAELALADAAQKFSFLAATDALTGLSNRRAFEEIADREWRRAIRDRTELSLLMIDVDSFKAYNDRYGHQRGDGVLVDVAACIARNLQRPADLSARFGGEEFVVILPACSPAGALMIAERVRAAVEALAIPHGGSSLGHVTVSVGAATVTPETDRHVRDLVEAADGPLYEAKRKGRNTVVVAGPA